MTLDRWRRAGWFGAIALAAIGWPGCSSIGKPGGPPFASVRVQGATPDAIRLALIEVFTRANFELAASEPRAFLFTKPGDRSQQTAYGDWGKQSVTLQVPVNWADLGSGSWEIRCNVVVVRGGADPRFQERQRPSWLRRGPYREMLAEVKSALEGQLGTGAAPAPLVPAR